MIAPLIGRFTDRYRGEAYSWFLTLGHAVVQAEGHRRKPGDRLIVEGLQLSKPGAKVQPEEYRPPGAVANTARQASELSQRGAVE